MCGQKEKGRKFTVSCEYGKVSCDKVTITDDWVICEGTDIKLTFDDEIVGYVKLTKIQKSHVVSIDENVWESKGNDT